MKIYSLKLENFMLYTKFYRVFKGKDIIGLVGENRTGKSTIPEAVRYNLFGVSRASREIDLIHHGKEQMMVTLVLDDDGRKITIKRGRDLNNNGLLEIEGVEKKGEAQEIINTLVGYTKEDFSLTVFFHQSHINEFMELSPADKKKHLMNWLKNNHWAILERSVLDDIIDLSADIFSVKTKLDLLKEDIFNKAATKEKIKCLEVEVGCRSLVKHKLEKQFSTMNANRKIWSERNQEIYALESEIEEKQEAEEESKGLKQDLSKLQEVLKKFQVKTKGLKEQVLRDKKARLTSEINDLNKKLNRAQDDMTGTCPILNESCDRIECDTNQVKKWEQSRQKAKADRKVVEHYISLLGDLQRSESVVQDAQMTLESTKSKIAGLDKLKLKLKALRAKQAKKRDYKSAELEMKIDALQEQMTDYSETIGGLKAKLSRALKSDSKIKILETQLSKYQTKLTRLRYLAYMFGKNGIPSQEIENAFDEIEDEINFILDRLGTKVQIEFRPDRELQTWEDYCVQCGWQFPKGTRTKECNECGVDRLKKRKDELQLRVLENGTDMAFQQDSGGGKTLISLAVRLALTRLKQRQSNSRFNVLFLDECEAMLDRKNKNAFIKLITKTLFKEFLVEQIFFVSHDPEIKESIPNVLQVELKGIESKTRWVS